MIQLVRYIEQDRIICTANDTYLEVRSTAGAGHYIQAQIFIDNVLHTTQVWSKKDSVTATRNILDLYRNNFINEFTARTVSALVPMENLRKRVDIKLKEINIQDDTVADTVDLPTFYIIPGLRPFEFSDLDDMRFLQHDVSHISAVKDTVLTFSIWVKNAGDITVNTLTPSESVLSTAIYNNASAGHIHEVHVLLDSDTTGGLSNFKLRITQGAVQLEREIIILNSNLYEVKEVSVKNNFLQHISYFIKGQLTVDHDLDHEIYRDKNNQLTNYSYTDEIKLTLQSGNLSVYEKETIAYVAQSVGAHLYIDNDWIYVSNETNKYNRSQDRKYIYTDALTFRFNNIKNRDNSDSFPALPEAQNLVFNGVENQIIFIDAATLQDAISPNPPTAQSIVFDSLPLHGRFSVNSSGSSFSVILGQEYDLSTITNFSYIPAYGQSGNNLESIDYRLIVNSVVTRPSIITINIAVNTATGQPPVVDLIGAFNFLNVNSAGNSIAAIAQSVSAVDPDGGPLTYLWTVVQGGSVVNLNNTTTSSVSISLSGATVGDIITLRITVTDVDNDSTSRDVSYTVISRSLILGSTIGSTSNGSTDHTISIVGATANSIIDVEHQLIGGTPNQSAVIDQGANNNSLVLSSLFNTEYLQVQTDSNGEASYTITTQDPLNEGAASLRVNITNTKSYDIVPGANETTLPW